ncbi:hypothetical protein BC937DRAFT_88509 [Endogone sp. FLAS-F59071]|nr:hypothetical protein BC937DRAFT_88509 [Endogone sp. FLAS-F59071]|eukprot:RUS23303.1 hypothetical protein BC937DRAFT_88509 [Endogone sp. FLAS-F59071]
MEAEEDIIVTGPDPLQDTSVTPHLIECTNIQGVPYYEYYNGPFLISTDPAKLDTTAVVDFLQSSYWAKNRSSETIVRSLKHSLCFSLLERTSATASQGSETLSLSLQQIGLARIVTDYATFAYIMDLYVLDKFRGRGLGGWLLDCVMRYPELNRLKRWQLRTKDQHEFYRRVGFEPGRQLGMLMEYYPPEETQTKRSDIIIPNAQAAVGSKTAIHSAIHSGPAYISQSIEKS